MIAICREVDKNGGGIAVYPIESEVCYSQEATTQGGQFFEDLRL